VGLIFNLTLFRSILNMATSVASQLAKLRKEREALEKREKALQTRTHTRAIEKILAIAKDAGLSASDISAAMGAGKKKSTKVKVAGAVKKAGPRGKVAPKYKNPADPTQTWTGRGKSPVWVQALKAAGTLDSALI
jgi:DNA-binding protein H-NS